MTKRIHQLSSDCIIYSADYMISFANGTVYSSDHAICDADWFIFSSDTVIASAIVPEFVNQKGKRTRNNCKSAAGAVK